jgi:cytosine deaminase
MLLSRINESHYWLKNAHIPVCLLDQTQFLAETREGLVNVDLEIKAGIIQQVIKHTETKPDSPFIDLEKKIIFPGFVDIHTHLDKGHLWERSPNLEGTFDSALKTIVEDVEKYYQADDVYRRMEFGLKCSYAHGTIALRTHLDAFGTQGDIAFEVFQTLQKEWQDKIKLQAVCLVSLDYFQTPEGVKLADKMTTMGTILGGVAYANPDLDNQLDRIFQLAKERNLDLDFHVDENDDPNSNCLHKVAEAALRNQFTGSIICGHCCSLAVQPLEIVQKTLALVKEANIGIVSLPMCNLFLQDRQQSRTPFWRGITRVHELKEAGIPVTFASDNCRDPFFGFGDHDGLEVLSQSVRIAHLDTPYGDWCSSVTKTPAELMNLPKLGKIETGLVADLIIFKARYFSELFSRPQSDRIVIRNGKQIDIHLPDYSELDDLVQVKCN